MSRIDPATDTPAAKAERRRKRLEAQRRKEVREKAKRQRSWEELIKQLPTIMRQAQEMAAQLETILNSPGFTQLTTATQRKVFFAVRAEDFARRSIVQDLKYFIGRATEALDKVKRGGGIVPPALPPPTVDANYWPDDPDELER
jgi:hypothetical protein